MPREFLTVPELADLLRIKERKVYDLAASGAVPCAKITGKLLFPEQDVRAWIESGRTDTPAAVQTRPNTFLGSHDPLLDWALRQSQSGLATYFDGSADGLARFAAGEGIATGLHMRDRDTGGWNTGAAQQTAGGSNAVLVAWATRARGIVYRDGEHAIDALADLSGCRFAARQAGSGAQTLFEDLAREAGLDLGTLSMTDPAPSETEAVLAVVRGEADAAFGLEAVAQPYGLRFLPLVQERFDLLVDRQAWFEAPLQKLWAFTRTEAFRQHASGLPGYDASEVGAVRWNA